MTAAQAQSYFNSVPASEQQAVRASGANIVDWANASEAAGDPRALSFSGTSLPGAGGGDDTYTGRVATGGQPSSTWIGQRKPTPAELRAYAAEQRWSEDFARFSDAQMAAWIGSSWDTGINRFKNDAGDVVDKPTESGPLSQAKGWATGEASTAGYWSPGRQGGAGLPAPPPVPGADGLLHTKAPEDPRKTELADLQNVLQEKFLARQGQFGVSTGGVNLPDTHAKNLQGGGLWWGTDKGMFDANTAPAVPATAAAPRPAAAPAGKAWQEMGGGLPAFPTTAPAQPAAQPVSPMEAELRRKATVRRKRDENTGAYDPFDNAPTARF